jgi:hypothetical protein
MYVYFMRWALTAHLDIHQVTAILLALPLSSQALTGNESRREGDVRGHSYDPPKPYKVVYEALIPFQSRTKYDPILWTTSDYFVGL